MIPEGNPRHAAPCRLGSGDERQRPHMATGTATATATANGTQRQRQARDRRLEDRHRVRPRAGRPGRRSDGPDDRFEEFDKPETVEAIAEVLRGEGHEVVLLGDGREFLAQVLADPPDFVWNMAEGEGVGRCREARVPAVLEMLGIPYTGSDPLTLAAALDKDVAKRLVASTAGVAVPERPAPSPPDADGDPRRGRSAARRRVRRESTRS